VIAALAVAAPGPVLAAEPPMVWSAWTASPVAVDGAAASPLEQDAAARCGEGERGLAETARAVLERKMRGGPVVEADELAVMQRAAGEPHPWARVWVASGHLLEHDATMARLDAWLGPAPGSAVRRCGVRYGEVGGARALVVVTVDALADLTPLPTRARPGEWLTVEARLRVRARGGEVLVLGPSGLPRALPTSFDGGVVRARFAPDRPGEFALQVIADVAGGPRPVLEATVFAGVDPPPREASRAAPGEDLPAALPGDSDRLAAMITAARASEGLPPLARDSRLDAVALAHAARMARAERLAHDTGDGDPLDRLRAAGVDAYYAGENVAHAASVALAHRALWASPSHRTNLLRREFERVGVGVVRDGQAQVWAVETFASER
jgi:uncharacterized protein YkwD